MISKSWLNLNSAFLNISYSRLYLESFLHLKIGRFFAHSIKKPKYTYCNCQYVKENGLLFVNKPNRISCISYFLRWPVSEMCLSILNRFLRTLSFLLTFLSLGQPFCKLSSVRVGYFSYLNWSDVTITSALGLIP